MSKENQAFRMAVILDKIIRDAVSMKLETVEDIEKRKRLIAEWKRRETELQKFIDDNKIYSVCYGCVYMRGNFNNTEEK